MESSAVAPGLESSAGAPGLESSAGAPGLESSAVVPGLESSAGAPGLSSSAVAPGLESVVRQGYELVQWPGNTPEVSSPAQSYEIHLLTFQCTCSIDLSDFFFTSMQPVLNIFTTLTGAVCKLDVIFVYNI